MGAGRTGLALAAGELPVGIHPFIGV